MSDIMPDGVSLVPATIKDDGGIQALEGVLKFLGKEVQENTQALKKPTREWDQKEWSEEQEKKDKQKEERQKLRDSEFLKTIGKSIDNVKENLVDSMLAPFALITEPLKNLFGVDTKALFESFVEDVKPKLNPKEADLLKLGKEGQGFLYLGSFFKKKTKDKEESGVTGLLTGLLGGTAVGKAVSAIGPALLKALPIAGIVGSLIWAVIDGISGFLKAEEWGVSKASGFLGAFFGGSGEGGIKDALKGAGKWGLMGLSIGTKIAPGIGSLIGAVAGIALGGVLGFIGGQKLAQGFDKLGAWLKDTLFAGFSQGFTTMVDWFKNLPSMLATGLKEGWEQAKEDAQLIKQMAINLWSSITEGFNNMVSSIKNEFAEFIADPKAYITDLWASIKEFIGSAFKGILEFLFGGTETEEERLVREEKQAQAQQLAIDTAASYGKDITGLVQPVQAPAQTVYGGRTTAGLGISTSNVQDAIITKTGQIIHTHEDDNIIATKNMPQQVTTGNNSELLRAISLLTEKISQLEPKLITVVEKGVSVRQSDLYSF